ncbi:MAG: TolC family protein [Bacteroidetes bacterium]|nr:TolC family protein [Bacteroidota bacterium]
MNKQYKFHAVKNYLSLNLNPWFIVLFILLIFNPKRLCSQAYISYQASLDTALKNNLEVKNQKIMASYQKQLTKTAYNIPNTNLSVGYGQINSIYFDNQLSASQTINFPNVYSHQKKVLNQQWQNANLNIQLKEHELKKLVKEEFYTLAFLLEKEKLLLESDSTYAEFLIKSEFRLAKGESNILEKTTAESQRGMIKIQLMQLKQDIQFYKTQFQFLLNTETNFEPQYPQLKLASSFKFDSSLLIEHPFLKVLLQQKNLSTANTGLEKSKLLPDIIVSYNNMSMRGNGADNLFYGGANRFQSAQIGIGIPLLSGTQRAKVTASNINQMIAENNYLTEKLKLEKQFEAAVSQYRNNINILNYYEQITLKNADEILKIANIQFVNGEINYLDWAVLVNQSISIKNNYLDAVKNYNDNIVLLNYLIGG